jgi:MraZ protein
LDRLQNKLDKSPAREADVRGFKRLYYAQTVKTPVKDGRILITDKLAAFAGLSAEVVLVGIDDHFELWDAARWRRYTQNKKAVSTEE